MKTKYTIENPQNTIVNGLNAITYFSKWGNNSFCFVSQCVDHDICVQGKSKEEAEKLLYGCIESYKSISDDLPEPPPKELIKTLKMNLPS